MFYSAQPEIERYIDVYNYLVSQHRQSDREIKRERWRGEGRGGEAERGCV
jgi:hypothetical protein